MPTSKQLVVFPAGTLRRIRVMRSQLDSEEMEPFNISADGMQDVEAWEVEVSGGKLLRTFTPNLTNPHCAPRVSAYLETDQEIIALVCTEECPGCKGQSNALASHKAVVKV